MSEVPVFEVAWEVANKVGGIYTVIRTKAGVSMQELGDRYYCVGLLNERQAATEVEDGPLRDPQINQVCNSAGVSSLWNPQSYFSSGSTQTLPMVRSLALGAGWAWQRNGSMAPFRSMYAKLIMGPFTCMRQAIENMRNQGCKIKTGRWLVDGFPQCILFDLGSQYHKLGEWKFDLFNRHAWPNLSSRMPCRLDHLSPHGFSVRGVLSDRQAG
jgi:hypothetical protein